MTKDEMEQIDQDFKWLMSSSKGRRLVFALLGQAGVFRTTAARGLLPDPAMDMAYAEGQKDLGYRVMSKIQALCPERYSQMMKEHENARRQQSERRTVDADTDTADDFE